MNGTKEEVVAIRREVERLARAVATDARTIADASREGTGDGAEFLSLEVHLAQLSATRELVLRRLQRESRPFETTTNGTASGAAHHDETPAPGLRRLG
jgi:hypothetical protein